MSLIELNKENFDDLINNRALVDFHATWCGPCKMLGPIVEEIANENLISVIKVDIDKFEDLSRKYGVMSVPTLILFENGKDIKKSIGFISKDELKEFIK